MSQAKAKAIPPSGPEVAASLIAVACHHKNRKAVQASEAAYKKFGGNQGFQGSMVIDGSFDDPSSGLLIGGTVNWVDFFDDRVPGLHAGIEQFEDVPGIYFFKGTSVADIMVEIKKAKKNDQPWAIPWVPEPEPKSSVKHVAAAFNNKNSAANETGDSVVTDGDFQYVTTDWIDGGKLFSGVKEVGQVEIVQVEVFMPAPGYSGSSADLARYYEGIPEVCFFDGDSVDDVVNKVAAQNSQTP